MTALKYGEPLFNLKTSTFRSPRTITILDSKLIFSRAAPRVSTNTGKFLFTGDIEETAEKRMLIWQNILKSNVLKVAHHGSASSSSLEFINKVDPIIAVITVGKNYFGHPSPKIIERLEDNNIKVYRTDENGTIIIRTDGKEYWVRTLR